MTRLFSILATEYHFSHAEILALPLAAAARYLYCIREKYRSPEEGTSERTAEIIGDIGSDYTGNSIDGWID